MREIALTQGKICLIDDEDFELVSQYKWYFSKISKDSGYARRTVNGKKVYMHRFLLQAPDVYEVDHIDGNKLNNQKHNLRVVSHQENCRNKKSSRSTSSSQYTGVYFSKNRNKWVASITISGHCKYLGCFDTETAAMEKREQHIANLGLVGFRLNKTPITGGLK